MSTAQVHSKFKFFIPEAGLTHDEAMRRLSGMVEAFSRDGRVAPKSLGIEFRESDKRLFLSLGYRDDEPGYPVKVTAVTLGALDGGPTTFETAMETAAARVENVICHEFYITEQNVFVAVFLSRS
jgi:hypothetical protein